MSFRKFSKSQFGGLLFILSGIHAGVHFYNIQINFVDEKYASFLVVNNLTMADTKNLTYLEWLLTDQPKVNGLIPGWANPTGVILITLAFVIAIGAHPSIRRKGNDVSDLNFHI